MSGIVEAVKGEGRTGRVGLVSILKDRINDKESGIAVAPLVLNGEPPGPRFRLILDVCMWVCNYVYAYMFKPKVALPADSHVSIPRPIGRCAGGPARRKARSADVSERRCRGPQPSLKTSQRNMRGAANDTGQPQPGFPLVKGLAICTMGSSKTRFSTWGSQERVRRWCIRFCEAYCQSTLGHSIRAVRRLLVSEMDGTFLQRTYIRIIRKRRGISMSQCAARAEEKREQDV